MPFQITIKPSAQSRLASLQAHERTALRRAIADRLVNQPTTPTRAVKLLRPNPFATFELRVGNLRVLYDVNESESKVVLQAVGRKVGNVLLVEGNAFHGHQDRPAEPAGDEPAVDPE